jgi:hypothetical protein
MAQPQILAERIDRISNRVAALSDQQRQSTNVIPMGQGRGVLRQTTAERYNSSELVRVSHSYPHGGGAATFQSAQEDSAIVNVKSLASNLDGVENSLFG